MRRRRESARAHGRRRSTRRPRWTRYSGPILVSRQTFDSTFERPQDLLTLVDVPGGPSPNEECARGGARRLSRGQAADEGRVVAAGRQKEFETARLLYVLLGLSVVVSLFGMVNTVVLSVFERTRELGMLRAIGMTRRQVRRMVRHESVITALIGAVLGLPLGIFLAALVTQRSPTRASRSRCRSGRSSSSRLIAVGAGLVAAAVPARRASRLNVLEALQYE